jgi:7-carboxy-7-deazaguanine synthase
MNSVDLNDLSDTARHIRLVELFSSIQGEGILVGKRQIFVRSYGCNLRCTYCDSPETLKESGTPAVCRVEEMPGSWQFRQVPSLVSAQTLTETVKRYLAEPHHSLSITGGEPLLHYKFWRSWLPEVRQMGLKTFLETNGLLTAQLKALLPWLDYVSMDIKPPTATGLSNAKTWPIHTAFLRAGFEAGTTIYAKMVVTASTADEELDAATNLIKSVSNTIPLILQPVTPCGAEQVRPTPARLIALHARASETLEDVRVIPQTHKMMQLL